MVASPRSVMMRTGAPSMRPSRSASTVARAAPPARLRQAVAEDGVGGERATFAGGQEERPLGSRSRRLAEIVELGEQLGHRQLHLAVGRGDASPGGGVVVHGDHDAGRAVDDRVEQAVAASGPVPAGPFGTARVQRRARRRRPPALRPNRQQAGSVRGAVERHGRDGYAGAGFCTPRTHRRTPPVPPLGSCARSMSAS